jgi:chorismate-pyruvate lyase
LAQQSLQTPEKVQIMPSPQHDQSSSSNQLPNDDVDNKETDGSPVRNAYDPLANIFVAQQHRPSGLIDLNLRTLSPVERALLVIDGTVTRFLEAYMMEPIDIVRLGETREILMRPHIWLDLPKGEKVVSRRVLLRGKYSDRVYASAASLVVPGRVKKAVQPVKAHIPEGLGRMLLNGRTEQYRELLWYGKEVANDLPGEMRSLTSECSMVRTYRIIVNAEPAMMITEWFELGNEILPAQQ